MLIVLCLKRKQLKKKIIIRYQFIQVLRKLIKFKKTFLNGTQRSS